MMNTRNPGTKLNVEAWAARVSEQQLPILRSTLHSFAAIVEDESSSTMRMAQSILQDAALTARVLRAANTSYYNQTGRPISTISRSLVLLGTDRLKNIALSIAILETVVDAELRERAAQVISRSFHAAVQARELAVARGDAAAEEAFIAALLLSIGELAFWCFSDGLGIAADEALKQGMPQSLVEDELIGCRFQRLTSELAREWKLNATLLEVLQNPRSRQPRARSVRQGHDIARLAEEQGWRSQAVQDMIKDLAAELHKNAGEIQTFLQENARAADELLRQHGFVASAAGPASLREDTVPLEQTGEQAWLFPDPMLQLRILRDLTQVFADDSPLHVVLEMVLEGLFRGIGLDRVVFAVLSADKALVQVRYVLDVQNPQAGSGQKVHLRPAGVLQGILDRASCVWKDRPTPQEAEALGHLAGPAPYGGYFVGPAVIRGQTIGVFYADRQTSGRPLDEESFDAFMLFVQQARLGLEHKQQRARES